jgi:hypothetical protein
MDTGGFGKPGMEGFELKNVMHASNTYFDSESPYRDVMSSECVYVQRGMRYEDKGDF